MSWSYINSAKQAGTGTSFTTGALAVTAGDLLIIVTISEAYDTHGSSSNPAETWAEAEFKSGAAGCRVRIAWAKAAQSTNYTFTGTVGTSDYLTVFGLIYRSTVGVPAAKDGSSDGAGSSVNLAVTGFTPTAVALVIGAGTQQWANPSHLFTQGTNYTERIEETVADSYQAGMVQDDVDAAASSQTVPMSSSQDANWAMAAVAFVEAGGGGLAIPVAMHHLNQMRRRHHKDFPRLITSLDTEEMSRWQQIIRRGKE